MMRLLPLILVLYGIYKGLEKAKPLIHVFERFTVEVEVTNIIRFMQTDAVGSELPTPEAFEGYLKKHVKTAIPGRDTSLDYWGTPFKLEIHERIVIISSAGPDKQFGTEDDIHGSFATQQ
jgi:hypothetical protein